MPTTDSSSVSDVMTITSKMSWGENEFGGFIKQRAWRWRAGEGGRCWWALGMWSDLSRMGFMCQAKSLDFFQERWKMEDFKCDAGCVHMPTECICHFNCFRRCKKPVFRDMTLGCLSSRWGWTHPIRTEGQRKGRFPLTSLRKNVQIFLLADLLCPVFGPMPLTCHSRPLVSLVLRLRLRLIYPTSLLDSSAPA